MILLPEQPQVPGAPVRGLGEGGAAPYFFWGGVPATPFPATPHTAPQHHNTTAPSHNPITPQPHNTIIPQHHRPTAPPLRASTPAPKLASQPPTGGRPPSALDGGGHLLARGLGTPLRLQLPPGPECPGWCHTDPTSVGVVPRKGVGGANDTQAVARRWRSSNGPPPKRRRGSPSRDRTSVWTSPALGRRERGGRWCCYTASRTGGGLLPPVGSGCSHRGFPWHGTVASMACRG